MQLFPVSAGAALGAEDGVAVVYVRHLMSCGESGTYAVCDSLHQPVAPLLHHEPADAAEHRGGRYGNIVP